MGWIEARRRYAGGVTSNKQTTEDLVARRALRGLGLVERNLAYLERVFHGEVRHNDALWIRTLPFLHHGMAQRGCTFNYELVETNETHKPIVAEIGSASYIHGTVFLTRVGSTKTSLAYWSTKPDRVVQFATPPFQVLESPRPGEWILVQETEKFIEQFGPYSFEVKE